MSHDYDEQDERQSRHEVTVDRQLGRIEERIQGCERALHKVENTLEKVRDRVPPWVVWVTTGMGGIIGSLITLLVR